MMTTMTAPKTGSSDMAPGEDNDGYHDLAPPPSPYSYPPPGSSSSARLTPTSEEYNEEGGMAAGKRGAREEGEMSQR